MLLWTRLAIICPKLDDDDIELKKIIAQRIKDLRERTGRGMSKFAQDTDKDKQSQNRWEKEGASIFTINKFCKEISISLNDFFNDPLFKPWCIIYKGSLSLSFLAVVNSLHFAFRSFWYNIYCSFVKLHRTLTQSLFHFFYKILRYWSQSGNFSNGKFSFQ